MQPQPQPQPEEEPVNVFDPVVENLSELLKSANRSAPLPDLIRDPSLVRRGGMDGLSSSQRWWDPPVIYRGGFGQPTWIAIQADDDLDTLDHAPFRARTAIKMQWKASKDLEASGQGTCRLIVAHELADGVGAEYSSGQQLAVPTAKSLVQSKPDHLPAALASAQHQARLERLAGGARSAFQRIMTPAEMVIAGTIDAARQSVQLLSVLAASIAALDPVVAVQIRMNNGEVLTTPIVAWYW